MNTQRLTFFFLLLALAAASLATAKTHYHEFVIQPTNVNRLCQNQNIVTVNGQYPGPVLEVTDGDTVVIKTTNAGRYNVTLHWHGLRQMRNPWADGPEYVTQCPIMPGGTYTYRFTIEQQEGTLWWHAHSQWMRATIYGALIIYPKSGRYPFPKPAREYPVILGEWWNRDPMSVLRQSRITGAAPNVSDALTINGQPGGFSRCSNQETTIFPVNGGETVLLRIINAAMNTEFYYGLTNHMMTVVAVDAIYTKPFTTNYIVIGPGQTTDVLVTMNRPVSQYSMAAHAYVSGPIPFNNMTTTALLQYQTSSSSSSSTCPTQGKKQNAPRPTSLPRLPFFNNTNPARAFDRRLRSPSPVPVPRVIDESLIITVGLGLINCSGPSFNCQGPNNTRFTASMNNVSFQLPTATSLMEAYYRGGNNNNNVFTTDFPAAPPLRIDYTGNVSRGLWQPRTGTKLYRLRYGSTVQVVFQGTSIVNVEEHPMHLHGYHFYVVGSGVGNFNPRRDPARFNLVDPPVRNTVGSVPGGWTAIRFVADNPGIWFMHCHIDNHIGWGLAMAFLVENGVGESQTVMPPPADLPRC